MNTEEGSFEVVVRKETSLERGKEFLSTFVNVTEDRIYKQFEHDQAKIDFSPRPSIFLPVTFTIKTYMKIPVDETGRNGITKEQAKEIVETFIIKEEAKIPVPPVPPSPKGSEMKPTSMCLHQ